MNITMTLDKSSIDDALKKLKKVQKHIEKSCEELVKSLVEYGIEVAKMEIAQLGAIDTGGLEESIRGVYFKDERCGVIFSDVPYALYVEYGTGIVGEQEPHPEYQKINWEYDSHGHGDTGWWYPAPFGWISFQDETGEDVKLAWTKGQPSKPFMYNTLRKLEEYIESGITGDMLSDMQ